MKRIALLLTMVMLLVLLVACGEPAAEKYTVNFVANGETVASVEYEKGTVPTAPTVEGYETLNMVYTFAGWDKEIVAVTEDTTYTATYTGATKEFNVTFIYGGATEGTPVKVPYGAFPAAPTTGLDYETVEKVYTFAGWDKQINAATADAVYTAKYTSAPREYTVTFKYGPADKQTTETFRVAYGTKPTAPTEGLDYITTDKKFTFKDWGAELAAVTGDVTYTATYTEAARDYVITFVYDGKTETVTLGYGATVTLPTPKASYTADGKTYTYAGTWDKTPVAVAGDATYTANYTLTEKVLYANDFNSVEDIDVVGETDVALSVPLGAWKIAPSKPYTNAAIKTVVDPNNAANKYYALGLSNTTAVFNNNMQMTGGLTAMESLTKLTIKIDLAKKPEIKVFDTYMRFRATGTSDTIKFLETTSASKIKFFGTEVGTLTETFQTIEMTFDFATGAATIKIDGVDAGTATMTVPSKSTATSLAEWITTTASSKYIFNWGVTGNCSNNEKGLLVDNLSVVAH